MLKEKFYWFYVFIFTVLISVTAEGTSLKFERFSNSNGFNQNTINEIVEDCYGFLWIGTPNGLIKYDGYEFQEYYNDPLGENTISHNYINCLYTDAKGILWIGTLDGIDVYVPQLERFLKVPITEKIDVSAVKGDKHGNIWISGSNQLFACVISISDVDVSFQLTGNLIRNKNVGTIKDFYFIDDKNILIASLTGLIKIDFELTKEDQIAEVHNIDYFESFKGKRVVSINKVNNIFWVGTEEGVYKTIMEANRMHLLKKYTESDFNISGVSILTSFIDNNDNIWFGTKTNGLMRYRFESDDFEVFKYDSKNVTGISSSRINCIFQDRYNVLWIGTAQGGLNKLDLLQKPFKTYSHNPYDEYTISDNLITDILEDKAGYLWITSFNGAISKSIDPVSVNSEEPIRFKRLEDKFNLKSTDVVRSVYEDDKGYVWLNADSMLLLYYPPTGEIKSLSLTSDGKKIPLNIINIITHIDDDRILLAGSELLVLKKPWQNITSRKNIEIEVESELELGESTVASYLQTEENSFWVGTTIGLFKVRFSSNSMETVNHYHKRTADFPLSNNTVFSLFENKHGQLWLGTFGGGLNQLIFDENGELNDLEYFRMNEGLPSDAVYGIIEENDTLLWISTDMGLCRINTRNMELDIYDVRDGLPNNNFRQSAYFKGKSGNFYFGGLNGLTVFNPKDLTSNEIVPKVVVKSLYVNNRLVQIGEKISGKTLIDKSISETEKIIIKPGIKTFAFDLVVQHSVAPEKNKLAYMLEGFNSTWIEYPAGMVNVSFMNLEPGDYILKIKGANSDGIWNQETTDMEIKVLPPWYKTWWSYSILIILIMGTVAGVSVYFIQHTNLKHRLKYEQIDKQRIDELNQGKLQFFTNISHEFQTPLTLISGPVEWLLTHNTDPQKEKYLSVIQNNTRRLLNLVGQLITFRQAEVGALKYHLSSTRLGDFIYPLTEAFEVHAGQKNINFFYKVSSPNEVVLLDQEKVERIVFNLLSNAFKYTSVSGNVNLQADVIEEKDKKWIRLQVIDDGKGIEKENLEKIFERFFQQEGRKENVGGTGIGLAYCNSIVDKMGGTINVESEPNLRTCFTVMLPQNQVAKTPNINVPTGAKSYVKDWMPSLIDVSVEKDSKVSDNNEVVYTILVVEDEPEVRNFLSDVFGARYKILLSEDGLDGYEKIKQHEPDLIISDVMMPNMTGFELCEKVKTDPALCHIPFILLTALKDGDSKIRGLEFGADDYISKPFSLKYLEVRVDKFIKNNIRLKDHFSKFSSVPDKGIDISKKDKEFLNNISKAIKENLSDSAFGVEELAREIGLSPSHFYRRLKQLTGQIPNVYLRNFRLQRAAELLASNEGLNVAEVMYQIGIESNSYFSTSFKKLHGVSPSEYLKKHSS